ncbi:Protein GCY-4 [Aphelenchoides avenae]|nr:Protein GCY-4 [Aphelenchus avenae]
MSAPIPRVLWALTGALLAAYSASQFTGAPPPLEIKIGMLFPRNRSTPYSFGNTASAAVIALDRIYRERLLPDGTNVSFYWRFGECNEALAVGNAYELLRDENVDFLVAAPCIDGAAISGYIATYYNIPLGLWGTTFTSQFADTKLYPTAINVAPNYVDLTKVICDVMKFYEWGVFSFIFQRSDNGVCNYFQRDMEATVNSRSSCVIGFKDEITSWNPDDIAFTIEQIKMRSRIILVCFDDQAQKRELALKMFDAGMANGDYLILSPDADMSFAVRLLAGTNAPPYWVDQNEPSDGRDADAEAMGRFGLQMHMDTNSELRRTFTNWSDEVVQRMTEWPFYCDDCYVPGRNASNYSPFLYDVVYLYGLALSKVINTTGTSRDFYRNGTLITDNIAFDFSGMSGNVQIGPDGIRNAIYGLSNFDNNNQLERYLLLQVSGDSTNITVLYSDAGSTIWARRGGVKPLAIPVCGFDGKGCPVPVFEAYKGYFISAIVVVMLVILVIISGIIYVIHVRQTEMKRQNELWQVSFANLVRVSSKNKNLESARSLTSGPSTTSTKFTFDSVKSSKNFSLYSLHGERVIIWKHHTRASLGELEMAELRAMRQFDHDNVNRFLGLCLDSPELLSVWRFCSRGSIRDVISSGNSTLNMDGFFVYSIIRDLAEGLCYLHQSFLTCHGNLKSSYCLIDERWQAKISYFGLRWLKQQDMQTAKDMLWTAPEVIRNPQYATTKQADVYSLAIICSEIINMKPVWENSNGNQPNAEEIVYMLKKGGLQPPRPELQPSVLDLNPAMLHLIRDCWSENPNERPKIETVRSLLKSMNVGRTTNLMDHVFNMLEQHAASLEEEVEERTKELVEEKKKSDILLYRMLPRQVAEKLKLGQSVQPESYDCVTVFFSDVVSFTTIAGRCTPLEVVNLLNSLYSQLDDIIGHHDVYKVETIGDGYLCVSGLPHRNGNEHARHIANMSLAFMRCVERFVIPNLPNERIRLRIGIHTGPCVAGVVGLAMPRYCLFGDTVNTASRMESNGKPDRIQMSAETNRFLAQIIGGYITESRGEVIIKGKGVMETFFLLGAHEEAQPEEDHEPPMYESFRTEVTARR